MLDAARLEQLEDGLRLRVTELTSTLSKIDEGIVALGGATADVNDRASNSLGRELLFRERIHTRQLLKMLEDAQSRIREGRFGECSACGHDINLARLQAVPWTQYCLECQQNFERQF